MVWFVLLSGCGALSDLQSTVEGATNRFVAEAVFMGAVEPDDPAVAEALAENDVGAQMTVFLADALEVADLDQVPIAGAAVSYVSDSGGGLKLRDEGEGRYELKAGLSYVPGELAAVSAAYEGENRRVALVTPEAPTVSVPETLAPGQGFSVDLAGQGFDSVLVMVMDISTGELSYSNAPEDIQGFYDLGHGDAGGLQVAVPPGAFPTEGIYVVGVAGLVAADPEDFVAVNTQLSTFMAARYRFSSVCTFADPMFCDPPDTGAAP